MVEFGSVEISEPPKSTILGRGGGCIFSPHQRGTKALETEVGKTNFGIKFNFEVSPKLTLILQSRSFAKVTKLRFDQNRS